MSATENELKPDRKIMSVQEIGGIVDAVRGRMDEPALDSKQMNFRVLNDSKFQEYLMKKGVSPERAAASYGSTSYKYADGREQYFVMLREAQFSIFFPSYFHEMGHVANRTMIDSLALSPLEKAVYSEAMAYSFENYAKERFNQLGYKKKFLGMLTRDLKKAHIKVCFESMSLKSEIEQRAFALIYGLLDIGCETFEEVYKRLRAAIRK